MSDLLNRLTDDFKDKVVRDVYCQDFLNTNIATQIKVLREQRGLTQSQLAELAKMKQSRIATMEDINYSAWTISTLKKLAKAFDVALTVRFDSFGEKLIEIDSFSRDFLEKPKFDDDQIISRLESNKIDIPCGSSIKDIGIMTSVDDSNTAFGKSYSDASAQDMAFGLAAM